VSVELIGPPDMINQMVISVYELFPLYMCVPVEVLGGGVALMPIGSGKVWGLCISVLNGNQSQGNIIQLMCIRSV
jgi:hypothetical protein